MGFVYLALKNMLRHRIRTGLTLLSIVVATGVLFAVVSYDRSFSAALEREMQNTGVHLNVVPTGCPHEAASLLLHGSAVPRVLKKEDLAAIEEFLGERAEKVYPMLIAQAQNMSMERLDVVYGLDRKNMPDFKPGWRLVQGEFPDSAQGVVLGFSKAQASGLQPGDTIEYQVRGRLQEKIPPGDIQSKLGALERSFVPEPGFVLEFEVSGVLDKTGTQDDGAVFAPLAAAFLMLGPVEGVTAAGVRLQAPEQSRSTARDLESEFPGIQAITPDNLLDTVTGVVHSARVLSFSMVVLVVVVSAGGVMNSILMTVFQRTREIGVMRALGASRMDIFRMTLAEALILTIAGGVLGILAVSAAAPLIENFVGMFLPYIPQGLTLGFDPLVALGCLAFAVVIGCLAGFYPAFKSSGISPVEAMRN